MGREEVRPGAATAVAPRRRRRLAIVLGGLAVVAACVAIHHFWGAMSANAEPKGDEARVPPPMPRPRPVGAATAKVVAAVNGEDVSRAHLAQECLRHYGHDVLDAMLNRALIVAECQRQGIAVTQEEVSREIERFATFYKVPVAEWLKKLKEERGIGAALRQRLRSGRPWPCGSSAARSSRSPTRSCRRSTRRSSGPRCRRG